LLHVLRTQQHRKEQRRNADRCEESTESCTNELELMVKNLEDTDAQFGECMQQIKDMAEVKDAKQKQLENLQKAAQVVVDMVDPPKEG
jgi:Fic family protein